MKKFLRSSAEFLSMDKIAVFVFLVFIINIRYDVEKILNWQLKNTSITRGLAFAAITYLILTLYKFLFNRDNFNNWLLLLFLVVSFILFAWVDTFTINI